MNRKFFYLNKKGFTLIEVLIVVAIIVLLVGVVLVLLTTSRKRSQDASFKQTARSVASAIELCCSTEGAQIGDKSSGEGGQANVCVGAEPNLFYPGDEAIDRVFWEKNCDNDGGYRVKVYPGEKNSGSCQSATIDLGSVITYEGC